MVEIFDAHNKPFSMVLKQNRRINPKYYENLVLGLGNATNLIQEIKKIPNVNDRTLVVLNAQGFEKRELVGFSGPIELNHLIYSRKDTKALPPENRTYLAHGKKISSLKPFILPVLGDKEAAFTKAKRTLDAIGSRDVEFCVSKIAPEQYVVITKVLIDNGYYFMREGLMYANLREYFISSQASKNVKY